jgi:hypothetical protein
VKQERAASLHHQTNKQKKQVMKKVLVFAVILVMINMVAFSGVTPATGATEIAHASNIMTSVTDMLQSAQAVFSI